MEKAKQSDRDSVTRRLNLMPQAFMSLQCDKLREGHAAHFALVRALSHVVSIMREVIRALAEDFVTADHFAHVKCSFALGDRVSRVQFPAHIRVYLAAKVA